MSWEPPCIGAGITVIDSGPAPDDRPPRMDGRPRAPKKTSLWSTRNWQDRPLRLLKVYVTHTSGGGSNVKWSNDKGDAVFWKIGKRQGEVWQTDEFKTWIRGHGPRARAALLAARSL